MIVKAVQHVEIETEDYLNPFVISVFAEKDSSVSFCGSLYHEGEFYYFHQEANGSVDVQKGFSQ